MHYETISCPKCKDLVDAHILGITSGLGPEALECRRCGTTFRSGRREWASLSGRDRVWYVAISLLYAIVAAFLGGMSTAGGVHFLIHGPSATEMDLPAPGLYPGIAMAAILVVAFQCLRVRESTGRAPRGKAAPFRARLANGRLLLQIKVGLLLFAPVILGWLVSYLLNLAR